MSLSWGSTKVQNQVSGFTKIQHYLLDRMVLRPSQDPLECGGQQRHQVQVDRQTIEYFSQRFGPPSDHADLVILKFPGTAGRAERSSVFPGNLLGEVSGLVITWNPPGYGGSTGRPGLRRIAEAARGFFAKMHQRHVAGSHLWLMGNSLGCNVAMSLAAADAGGNFGGSTAMPASIDGMILRNPPPLVHVVKRVARNYPLGRLVKPIAESLIAEMNADITAPLSRAPTVFLKSMSDSLVPPKLQDRLIRRYGGPRQVVPLSNLEHDGLLTDQHEHDVSVALDWLWQQTLLQQQDSNNSKAKGTPP
jgi:pimeloyl-ACP methyl ester carboxylesterase